MIAKNDGVHPGSKFLRDRNCSDSWYFGNFFDLIKLQIRK